MNGTSEIPEVQSTTVRVIPLGNHLLVEKLPFERTTSGIELPPSMQDDYNTGGAKLYRVLAVGPGRRLKNGEFPQPEIWPGDRVFCHSYTQGPESMEIPNWFLITFDQVIAVLPGPNNQHKDS